MTVVETQFASDSDTDSSPLVRIPLGQKVRVVAGTVKDIEGNLIERRKGGKVLVRITGGICIETHEHWLERVE